MAKRRKVGNMLALAILANLLAKPMHPYELATELRERGKDRDMPIKWGSLYTVVGNLEKHDFIRAVHSERQGLRPERTVYEITEAGRAELTDWLREIVGVAEREIPRFEAGLSLIGVLPPDEVVALLEQRLADLTEQLAAAQAALDAAPVPRIFLLEAEYDLAVRRAEADWIEGLLGELRDGTLPGAKQWREWHENGADPSKLLSVMEELTAEGRPAA
ncbi:MAG: PadR family transcriptional regulator [Hamadaea sp.]|nr:PadR family transcriptional regulator [Hamadaea sp.]NUT02607.1 PadR family transcriptional regulator [Hamadaea sp.]